MPLGHRMTTPAASRVDAYGHDHVIVRRLLYNLALSSLSRLPSFPCFQPGDHLRPCLILPRHLLQTHT
jgi:hypothetical protein